MADDIPYLMKTAQGELWEAPVHWGTDDWPPFAHYAEIDYMMPVKAPSEGLKAFWEEFDAQYEAGGFWIGIWHPFLTGRLARWRQVEQWLEHTLKTKKVWFASLEEIIAHVKKVTDDGSYTPRVEQLPYYTLGTGTARTLVGELQYWTRSVRQHAERPMSYYPQCCRHLCHDECMALSIIAAAQAEDQTTGHLAARYLTGQSCPARLSELWQASLPFAAALAQAGQLVTPVTSDVVDWIFRMQQAGGCRSSCPRLN
jgi:hypothetical protein